MVATAHTLFVPGLGYRWQVRDGAVVLYESEGGFVSEAEAEAVGAAELGSDWPGTPADGTWHYIGEAGEPAFQNSWDNYATDKYQLAFRVLQSGEVDLHGSIIGGASATIATTLDSDLWPVGTEDYIAATAREDGTNAVGPAFVEIATDGTVKVFWTTSFTPDAIIISGSYYLTPPTGP